MPVISYSERDILAGTVVEPAWYRVRIDSVGEEPSKDKGSTNYPIEGTILFNGDTGDTKFANVPLSGPGVWSFNSKAIGFSKGFMEVLLGEAPKANTRYDLKAAEGLTLDVYVDNNEYQGRIRNKVNHTYRKPKPEVNAVS